MKIRDWHFEEDREALHHWLHDSLPLRKTCDRNGPERWEPDPERPGWYLCAHCSRPSKWRDIYCYPLITDRQTPETEEAVNAQLRSTRDRKSRSPDYDGKIVASHAHITNLLRSRKAEYYRPKGGE